MKKLILTIILFVLIAVGFVIYNTKNDGPTAADPQNTAIVVTEFINEMIPHHEAAVKASLKVMNDKDIAESKVRIFAANIVDTQTFEIERMKTVQREYLGSDYTGTSTSHHMDSLENLTGDELAKAYARSMVDHHEDAIDAAKDYIKKIDRIKKATTNTENGLTVTNSHPAIDDTYDLAKQIIETQEKEIAELKSWY